MYLMVGAWGSGGIRGPVAVKFFVYTMFGFRPDAGAPSFYLFHADRHFRLRRHSYCFLLWPRHSVGAAANYSYFSASSWLSPSKFPSSRSTPGCQTPTLPRLCPPRFLLAAVMSKMGTYGLLRFSLTMSPGGAQRCASWIAVSRHYRNHLRRADRPSSSPTLNALIALLLYQPPWLHRPGNLRLQSAGARMARCTR